MTKILLVEDSEMSRDMLARRLARRGYDVVIAVDGAQGVTLAQSEVPDLILMKGLPAFVWVIVRPVQSSGRNAVRILSRRYSSSRRP